MTKTIDFEGLAKTLLGQSRELLTAWFPAGRIEGHEFKIGALTGEAGESLSINVGTGAWADFAGDAKGGDLISLFAAKENLKQAEAAGVLMDIMGLRPAAPEPPPPAEAIQPPVELRPPDMHHSKHGKPTAKYTYSDRQGRALFYVARYDHEDSKSFCWFTWNGTKWAMKAWPAPRPLYGLELLDRNPDAPVLVVEGEKACDAARLLCNGVYVVMSWPGGAAARARADWGALAGRNVLLWPDADSAGQEAMKDIAGWLAPQCPEVKVLDVTGQLPKWDAADAVANGWTWENFFEWAKPRARVVPRPALEGTIVPNPPLKVDNPDGEPAASPSIYAEWEKLGIVANANGSAVCNIDNALRVIQGREEFENLIWLDEFHKRYFTRFDFSTWKDGPIREWADVDSLNLTTFVQRHLNLKRMSDDTVQKAALTHASRNIHNQPREWLAGLVWDKEPRLEGFFSRYMGADKSDYTKSASENFWIGIAARIMTPGCQLDNMVVLEGAQGTFKTSALRAIGGDWYTGTNESVQSKDFFMVMHGKIIVEIPEMDSFSKADVTKIKQIITNSTDRFRLPYARSAADYPRMSVFVGTTNESQYLRDATGARRFWPIACGKIDLERIKADREQLFAEAAYRFGQGEKWHIMPAEATAQVQEERRQQDAWEDEIASFLLDRGTVTTSDIGAHLKIDAAHLDLLTQRRIGSVMRVLGWRKTKAGKKSVWTNEELPF